MSIERIMIAAPKSGSGKTSVTLALLQALTKLNIDTVSFKCGPDYIDPLFHMNVLGIPSFNLDTFFTDEDKTRELFERNSIGHEFALIEGVMGLFDGMGGIHEEGSSYHLARVTNTPIILVVDAKGASRSLLPLIAGFKSYDTDNLIRGVILNRCSKSTFDLLKPLIEETGLKAVGFMSDRKDVNISSRHLGLTTPDDIEGIREIIANLTDEFVKNVSIEDIQKIAKESDSVSFQNSEEASFEEAKCTIAVAKDEAFCFIYEDNLIELRRNGAKIIFFSPLHDKEIPEEADALLLPGGYPELHLEGLSDNISMRESVLKAFQKGMPIIAECGGFMYLHRSIKDSEGKEYDSVGAIDANCFYTGKLVRFGYVSIRENNISDNGFLPAGSSIKGHEFHYYDSEQNGDDCTAIKPSTGREYGCVIEGANYWLGFPHLYYPSEPSFARNFVKKAYEFRDIK